MPWLSLCPAEEGAEVGDELMRGSHRNGSSPTNLKTIQKWDNCSSPI